MQSDQAVWSGLEVALEEFCISSMTCPGALAILLLSVGQIYVCVQSMWLFSWVACELVLSLVKEVSSPCAFQEKGVPSVVYDPADGS